MVGGRFQIRALLADTDVFKDETPPIPPTLPAPPQPTLPLSHPPPPPQPIPYAVNYFRYKKAITYSDAIALAIRSSPKKSLPLSEIYRWVEDQYPEFPQRNINWRNTIRHNLSHNKIFTLVRRPAGDPGRGQYWTIDAKQEAKAKRNPRGHQTPKTSTTALALSLEVISPPFFPFLQPVYPSVYPPVYLPPYPSNSSLPYFPCAWTR